ncbi:hypothetical protein ACO0E1_04740 [Curtobacterium sp. RRHDQ66]|uniref:hypothetical protein n=1 Tax=Curtobacterium guangdongense TaxID=3413380 RepID=UPI003BEF7D6E
MDRSRPSPQLADADSRVLGDFLSLAVPAGRKRAYAENGERPTEEQRQALPPLAFEDEALRVLIDTNKGFPAEPVRRTYAVLRELRVRRRATAAELEAMRSASEAGLSTPAVGERFDVIDEDVFRQVFPEQ